ALQDQRQTKQTPHDLAVLLARGPPTQISRRMIRVRDDDRLTHDDPPAPESAQVSESHTAPGGNPPRESQPEAPGIRSLTTKQSYARLPPSGRREGSDGMP